MAEASKANSLTSLSLARIKKKVKMYFGGNSNRDEKDFLADVINNSGESFEDIAADCYLHKKTIENLASGKTQNPQHETLTRLNRHFGIRFEGSFENIKPLYRNKPKV